MFCGTLAFFQMRRPIVQSRTVGSKTPRGAGIHTRDETDALFEPHKPTSKPTPPPTHAPDHTRTPGRTRRHTPDQVFEPVLWIVLSIPQEFLVADCRNVVVGRARLWRRHKLGRASKRVQESWTPTCRQLVVVALEITRRQAGEGWRTALPWRQARVGQVGSRVGQHEHG